ncbi:L-lactate permease [Marinomonas posidonica]|uniref:L-lactate permease n=1 Tax=Marinomonas posidonica (strain CECT 7376 / NCIMB 14433 / IVIA-Po-181) TaxID=491952 RepID=F6CSZ5_MARPP|nr:L-lactate permease [Marinomonas posidonica]AEF55053.1 L-lactate transport [Marinomonas posidonica IVIA-Po-181]
MPILLSALPILLLIWAMTKRRSVPSHFALPATALLVAVIQYGYFEADGRLMLANSMAGIMSVLTPISIVAGAILLNRVLFYSGAEAILSRWLRSVSHNKVAQLMIIGWAFAFMIEGASGFGTPAAIAAPILIGLGFPVLPVAILTLTMNSIPVSFGAVGTPIWFGLSGLSLTQSTLSEVAQQTAMLNMLAAFVVPVIALRFVIPWREIWSNLGFIVLSILSCTVPYVLVAQWNLEFPALIGGAVGLVLSVILATHGVGLKTPPNDQNIEKSLDSIEVLKALSPFVLLIVILLLTRLPNLGVKAWLNSTMPMWQWTVAIGEFEVSQSLVIGWHEILGTDISWQYKSLYVPALIPFVLVVLVCVPLFRMSSRQVILAIGETGGRLRLPCVSLIGALVMVNLMMQGETSSPMFLLAQTFAQALGESWAYTAALLGALGSFFSGSATVSNLTFGGIQLGIAESVGLPVSLVLALQSAGAAMGNMVCINNIIAVSTIAGIRNKEGVIIKRTLWPMLAYALVAGLYSYAYLWLY